jgi:hypothetical protein
MRDTTVCKRAKVSVMEVSTEIQDWKEWRNEAVK